MSVWTGREWCTLRTSIGSSCAGWQPVASSPAPSRRALRTAARRAARVQARTQQRGTRDASAGVARALLQLLLCARPRLPRLLLRARQRRPGALYAGAAGEVAVDLVARAVALLAAQVRQVPGDVLGRRVLQVNGAHVPVGCAWRRRAAVRRSAARRHSATLAPPLRGCAHRTPPPRAGAAPAAAPPPPTSAGCRRGRPPCRAPGTRCADGAVSGVRCALRCAGAERGVARPHRTPRLLPECAQ